LTRLSKINLKIIKVSNNINDIIQIVIASSSYLNLSIIISTLHSNYLS